jgi:hypothetical protein
LGKASDLHLIIQGKVKDLQLKRHIPTGGQMYIDEIKNGGSGVTLVFWASEASTRNINLWTYSIRGKNLFLVKSNASVSYSKEHALKVVEHINLNLRDLQINEIPSDPGVCIEGGFIADSSGQYQEIFSIGFRFPSMPDVSFSISSNKDQVREAPFSHRRAQAKKAAEESGLGEAFASVSVLRAGKRMLATWKVEEALFARPPADGGVNHEFVMESPGIRFDKDQPFWDAALHTGVRRNTVAANPSSLSSADAVWLWDRLLGSLRLRVVP